jgi:hypothetical protein
VAKTSFFPSSYDEIAFWRAFKKTKNIGIDYNVISAGMQVTKYQNPASFRANPKEPIISDDFGPITCSIIFKPE